MISDHYTASLLSDSVFKHSCQVSKPDALVISHAFECVLDIVKGEYNLPQDQKQKWSDFAGRTLEVLNFCNSVCKCGRN